MGILTLVLALPLVGAIAIALLDPEDTRSIKFAAMGASLATFVASLVVLARFDTSIAGFQLQEKLEWIPTVDANYHVGVDGISLVLLVLTTFLTPLVLLGRVDDIMLVSGHNISTTEVESALVSHPSVAEAAVVGRKDELTGQAIAAFVTLRGDVQGDEDLLAELRDHVANTLGPIAKPKSLVFTNDLPKTRSGKIMRRLLQDISEDRQLGDVTTLANADIVAEIADKAKEGSPE